MEFPDVMEQLPFKKKSNEVSLQLLAAFKCLCLCISTCSDSTYLRNFVHALSTYLTLVQ